MKREERHLLEEMDRAPRTEIGIVRDASLDKTNDIKFFHEGFLKVAVPPTVAPNLVLTPIAPADLRAGDLVFSTNTAKPAIVTEVRDYPQGRAIYVVDETTDLSYVLDTEEMRVSWAYRLEVKP